MSSDGLGFIYTMYNLDEAIKDINDANNYIGRFMGNKHIIEKLKIIKNMIDNTLLKIDTDKETVFEFNMINSMMDEAEWLKNKYDEVK